MTCVVGFIDKEKNRVIIGADSLGVGSDYSKKVRKDSKVFRVSNGTDEFVIGGTTSFRMLQLLMFSFIPPRVPDNPDELYKYMCTFFVDEIRRSFKDGGFIQIKDNSESGGQFLVGYKDRLFEIDSDFQVAENYDSHSAVGCGAMYAEGAMSILSKDGSVAPIIKVIRALWVATELSSGVQEPFNILTTDGEYEFVT